MASLTLKQGTLFCQIMFSSLIILDILATANTILPLLLLDKGEENRTGQNLNVTFESVEFVGGNGRGVDIALATGELAALAILIICNISALR